MSAILDRQIMTTLIHPIRADLGITDVQFGLLQGLAFGVCYAILGVPIAYLADVGDRRKLIAAGLVLWSAMTLAGGLAKSFAMLFTARMLIGIGEASFNPAAYSMIADTFPRHQLSRALGLITGAFVMSTGLSIFTSGWLFGWFTAHPPWFAAGLAPWRLTMIATALPAPFLGLLLLFTVREPPRHGDSVQIARPVLAVWSELVRNRGVLLLVILGVAAGNVHINAQLTWFPAYLIRLHGYSVEKVGVQLGGVAILAGLVGPLLGGLASDMLHRRLGAKAPLAVLICAACGALIQAIAPLARAPEVAILAFCAGYMAVTATFGLAAALIQISCGSRIRARVSGVYIAVSNLVGLTVGPVLVPLLARHAFARRHEALEDAMAAASLIAMTLALMLLTAAYVRMPDERKGGTSLRLGQLSRS